MTNLKNDGLKIINGIYSQNEITAILKLPEEIEWLEKYPFTKKNEYEF